MWHFNICNGMSQVDGIKPEGRIHLVNKGLKATKDLITHEDIDV